VLALGVAGTTFLSVGLMDLSTARAQDKPTAAASLEQAKKNFELKHYAEAKAALDDIDAGQLPPESRDAYSDLKSKVTAALAAAPAGSSALESAKLAIENKKFSKAVEILKGITNSPTSSEELKNQANQQLAVATAEQAKLAPKMQELLKQAEAAVEANKLDDASDMLTTIEETGAPLGGFEQEAKPANLRSKIAMKRAAAVVAATIPAAPTAPVVETPAVPTTNALTAAATMESGAPAPAPARPMDDILNQTFEQDKIAKERAITQYNLAMERAQLASDKASVASQYDDAIRRAEDAKQVIDNNKRYFAEDEYNALVGKATALRNTAVELQKAMIVRQEVIADEEARIKEMQEAQARKEDRQRQIALLFRDADTLLQQLQYPEAAAAFRHILVLEPNNYAAKAALRLTEDTMLFRTFEKLNQVQGAEFLKQAIISKELLIPYADLLVYPEDWVEISRYRIAEYQNSLDSPRNRAVRERLEQNLQGVIKTEPTGEFAAVLERWRALTNLNVVPNWKTIEATIPRNSQITIDLHDVTARQALQLILEEASGGQATPLGYTIDDGVIRISTQDEINKRHKITRTYNIRELLLPKNTTFNVPQVGTNNNYNVNGGGNNGGINGGGGGGGNLFGGNNNNQNGGNGNNDSALATFDQKAYDDAALHLMQTIADNVDRESWATIGDTPWTAAGAAPFGTMRNFQGTLIITTTAEDHAKVYDLLARIREQMTILISIESRLLLVSNNFLDDFGIGWNLGINGGALGGSISGGTVPPPGMLPITVSNGTFAGTAPIATGVPGSLGGNALGQSLTTGFSIGTILDNWQLSIFLRATQADKRTTNVAAPRVTLFDDDTAQISFSNNVSYVAGFNNNILNNGGVLGGAVIAGGPTIGTAQANTTLTVHATVSPDRRYVAMNIQPHTEAIDGFDTVTFGLASQGASGGANGGNVVNLGTAGNIIQLPRTRTTDLTSRVSVPDGGTLLLGGQKQVGESEIEMGVPVLSKIPGLNRLFTNRSFVRDEQTLLILVRPRIIIQREQEIRRFGVDYDKPSNLPRLQGGANNIPRSADNFSFVPAIGAGH
jgi:general secretion pathway protein D